VLLFMASIATVLFSTFQTLAFSLGQDQVHDRLREASKRMAEAAEPELGLLQDPAKRRLEALNERLQAVSNQALADFPGVEGGFYVDAGFARFAGYGFPTDKQGPLPRGKPPLPKAAQGDDNPPPKEKQFILVQAQNSLSGDTHFDVRTVGPSRVAILTQPVGSDRPAQLATWTMFRLISPEPGKAIAPLPTLHRLGPWRDCPRHGVDGELGQEPETSAA